ncbi:hypothetical protein QBC36DRAFT_362016 [Triangularia setosa]|uniref:Uncharacterized protein n=1 Tax=Triangularia setosa TaxID=2587417 RepID=A0AAN6W1R4_9PEZI|nr:hypothetical protein QBC36DRAFT_362016 [Podospora setosa]
MDDLSRMSDVESDFAIMDATPTTTRTRPGMVGVGAAAAAAAAAEAKEGPSAFRSPLSKTRSLSDGGGTPKLSPSPYIVEANRRQSKDDIAIRDKDTDVAAFRLPPSTPIRAGFSTRGLSLQMPPTDPSSPAAQQQQAGYVKQAPLSPKLDHSHIYASPTNILPRRSRGLDFSRAATSLHHSTLANQADPDSSPTTGSRAMSIPTRRNGDQAGVDHPASSHWGTMGSQERMQISSSLGSTNHVLSDTSSDSDEDDFMDEDMEEAYIMTPQASKTGMGHMGLGSSAPWMPGSPAVSNFLSFQQRQRQRKQSKKKMRGPLGLGFHSPAASGAISKSPPNNLINSRDLPHTRRESISWAANQLHISGNESDGQLEGLDSPSRPSIVRRAVTRRGNLLPKTKGFARIRAALAEEGAPIETEFRREAEVVRQVRESDMDLEPRLPPAISAATTALSSPNLDSQVHPDEMMPDDAMMIEGPASSNNNLNNNPLGLSPATFKQQVLKNSKGKTFWDTFPESSSNGAAPRTTTPPPPSFITRASSSGLSLEDVNMDSPSSNGAASQSQNPFVLPQTTTSSSGHGTPHQPPGGTIPSAAEITRRINSKRRRGDDDFDPISIKRRAVSPGMSAHGSPVMQSPLQRENAPWGTLSLGPAITTQGGSRPGSVGGDSGGKAEGGTPGSVAAGRRGRVGLQGMVDTNDGITRLSIE